MQIALVSKGMRQKSTKVSFKGRTLSLLTLQPSPAAPHSKLFVVQKSGRRVMTLGYGNARGYAGFFSALSRKTIEFTGLRHR